MKKKMLSQDYFNYRKQCIRYVCLVFLLGLFKVFRNLPHCESVQFSVYYGKFYHIPYRICYEVIKSSFSGIFYIIYVQVINKNIMLNIK
jgi:hypothetical protein